MAPSLALMFSPSDDRRLVKDAKKSTKVGSPNGRSNKGADLGIRDWAMMVLAVEPRLDRLHSNLHFQELVRRIGLQP